MIPGIDFVGRVRDSSHASHSVGDLVVLNGWGVGETHLGGYAEVARVPGDWLVPLPDALSDVQAMGIGTAGSPATPSVIAPPRSATTPNPAPLLVTGAAGAASSAPRRTACRGTGYKSW